MKNLLKSFACILFACSMFACNKENDCVKPMQSNCSGKSGKTITVTVGNAVCGYGVWGSTWLMPKDSAKISSEPTWLQPYSLENGLNYTPKSGEILEITYTEAKLDNRYNNIITCLAYPGKSIPVHILCIKSVTNSTTALEVTKNLKVFMSCSGTGVFGEKWLYDETTNSYLKPCKWIGKAASPAFDDMNGGDIYEVYYTPSASSECQDNFNNNPTKLCFAAPPKSTPIDIWTMKKVK